METLRAGLTVEARASRRFVVEARLMGIRPGIDLDRSLRLADHIEDKAIGYNLVVCRRIEEGVS